MSVELIEVTDSQTKFKTTVNVNNVLMVTGADHALIIFENSNISTLESYSQIKELLKQIANQ